VAFIAAEANGLIGPLRIEEAEALLADRSENESKTISRYAEQVEASELVPLLKIYLIWLRWLPFFPQEVKLTGLATCSNPRLVVVKLQ